jgi:hypothetical protein
MLSGNASRPLSARLPPQQRRWPARLSRIAGNNGEILVALGLPQHLRQPRDVHGDPARLVLRQHLRLQSFGRVVARVQIGKRLAVGVAGDVTARNGVGAPWCGETARCFCHRAPPTPLEPRVPGGYPGPANFYRIYHTSPGGAATSASARPRRSCATSTSGPGDGCALSPGSNGNAGLLALPSCDVAASAGTWRQRPPAARMAPGGSATAPLSPLRYRTPSSPRSTLRPSASQGHLNPIEPPCTDPYVRWCGRGRPRGRPLEGPDSNEGQSGPSPGIPQSPEGMTPVWSGEILTALVRARAWAAEPIVQ